MWRSDLHFRGSLNSYCVYNVFLYVGFECSSETDEIFEDLELKNVSFALSEIETYFLMTDIGISLFYIITMAVSIYVLHRSFMVVDNTVFRGKIDYRFSKCSVG